MTMVALINKAMLRAVMAVGELRARMAEERGQDMLEYALLGGLIAAALTAVAVFAGFTGALESMADGIGACIDFDDLTPCG